MSKPEIIFRADGGSKIGMGHFTRTLALAEMLNEEFCCIYATRQPTTWQRKEIDSVCHGQLDLPSDVSHFDRFLAYLTGNEIVVLDNYYFTTDYQRAVKAKGCRLVCIDDIHDKHFVADVVINHAVGLDEHAYSKEPYTKLLLGYRHALLRGAFLIEDALQVEKVYSIMVMMGGADPNNLTLKVVQAIRRRAFDRPIVVVVGSAYRWVNSLKSSATVRVFQGVSPEEVLNLMRKSIVGVFPASTVAVEACAARIPFVTGYFVENQEEIFEGLKKAELAECYGDFNCMDERLGHSVRRFYDNAEHRRRIQAAQCKALDKKSPQRLKAVFRDLQVARDGVIHPEGFAGLAMRISERPNGSRRKRARHSVRETGRMLDM
jgi:UDP-2,4-diacetamido-2,4,6-trideoxy-beta-L-altropyranose hydrolase